MNWKAHIQQFKKNETEWKFVFDVGASEQSLNTLKRELGLLELPAQMQEFYTQYNGIKQNHNVYGQDRFLWPVNMIIEENVKFRNNDDFKNLYMSFNQLLFFADAGNGDQFAFCTINGRFDRNDIFVWNHENDSRNWVAPDLKSFIEWWLTGKIKL